MMIASTMAGMSFINAFTGGVHATGHALGAIYHVPHGMAMNIMLPHLMAYNLGEKPERFAMIADAMGVKIDGMTTEQAAQAAVQAVKDLQKAVGLTQTAKAGRVIAQKLAAMRKLHELLANVDGITLPAGIEEGHGAHVYVIRVNSLEAGFSREMLQAELKKHGVGSAVHYPAVWSWEVFANIDHDRTGCPVAERACAEVLSLPVHPLSTDLDLEYTAWAVKQSIRELRREITSSRR